MTAVWYNGQFYSSDGNDPGLPPLPAGAQVSGTGAQGSAPVDPVQQSINDFLSRLDPINQQLLASQFQSMSPQQVQASIAALQKQSAAAGGTADSLNKVISDLQNQAGGVGKALSNLATQQTDLASQAGALGSQLTPLQTRLGQIGTNLAGVGNQVGGTLGALQNQYASMAAGNDPRLQVAFQDQSNVINQQRALALRAVQQENARTGVVGTAALNDLARTNAQYDQAQQALAANLATLGLNRSDTALANLGNTAVQNAQLQSGLAGQEQNLIGGQARLTGQQAGLFGTQSGLLGSAANTYTTQLGALGQLGNLALQGANFGLGVNQYQTGLTQSGFNNQLTGVNSANQATQLGNQTLSDVAQNYAAAPALNISALAAQNAGNVPSSGSITVICTLLHERGDITDEQYGADAAYVRRNIDQGTYAGYARWAIPLARAARRNHWLYRAIRPFGKAWARHMSHLAGKGEADKLGWLILALGVPICRWLGRRQKEGNPWPA